MTMSVSAFALLVGTTEAQAPAARVTMRAKLMSSMVDVVACGRWENEPRNVPPFYRIAWYMQLRTERVLVSSLCLKGTDTPLNSSSRCHHSPRNARQMLA